LLTTFDENLKLMPIWKIDESVPRKFVKKTSAVLIHLEFAIGCWRDLTIKDKVKMHQTQLCWVPLALHPTYGCGAYTAEY